KIPLSFTFIITIGGSNIYQAFIAGGNGLPVFTESNYSFLMNNDILASTSCLNGCTITQNPGLYNATRGIFVNHPGVTITGSTASIIQSQNVTFASSCGS